MVNIPRALFTDRTGREPRHHVAIDELWDFNRRIRSARAQIVQ
jgi:hypothetical protein